MILSLKDKTWFKPVISACLLLSFVTLWAYITSVIFLSFKHMEVSSATPITAYQYWYYYSNDPLITNTIETSALLGSMIAAIPFFLILRPRKLPLHGESSFATIHEIRKAGLLSSLGIILGKIQSQYIITKEIIHTIVFAPSGSGKTTGIAIPNLLSWNDSVVVLDIKGELYEHTAGFRSAFGQKVYCFEPLSKTNTHRWNPLEYISKDKISRIGDIQKVASMIWRATEGESGYWDGQSRDLFLGIALLVMESPDLPFTLSECLRQTCHADLPKHFKELIKKRSESGSPLPSNSVRNLLSFSGMADRTQSSVLSNFKAALELFQLPEIEAATSANDFDFSHLRKRRMSIYIVIPPDDLPRMAPFVNLFVRQALGINTAETPERNRSLKHKVLFVLDEFAAIGKIDVIATSISYLRGYGVFLLTIVQTPSQIYEKYGEHTANNIIANHKNRVVFGTSDDNHAKQISESLGYNTVKSKSISRARGFSKPNSSETESDQKRALLLPQEVKRLPDNKIIITRPGLNPIIADKIVYYDDETFTSRIMQAPLVPEIVHVLPPDNEISISTPDDAKKPDYRPVTMSDVLKEDALDLSNLKYDFSKIEVPKKAATSDQIDSMVSKFFEILEEAA